MVFSIVLLLVNVNVSKTEMTQAPRFVLTFLFLYFCFFYLFLRFERIQAYLERESQKYVIPFMDHLCAIFISFLLIRAHSISSGL